jgi:poly-gamma-glutamate capsule biosynthesis protein CapA/YwtB (metallophosphatase superfamily)
MNFLRLCIRIIKAKSLYILLFLIVGLAAFFMFRGFYRKVDVSANLEPQKQEVKAQMTLSFVGDLLMHTPVRKSGFDSKTNTYNFNSFFTDIKPFLENKDYVIGSLESPIAKKDADKFYSGYPVFNNPLEFIDAVKNMGVDAVVTANNHSLDQGSKGVAETLTWIDKYNMPHTGTYKSSEERSGRPIIFYEKNGIKIAVANYTEMTNGISGASYAVNYIDTSKIKQDIDFARSSNADTVIVWLHFGNEYQRIQSENQKKIVNEVAKLGADIIIGSHPHVIQPMEIINVDGRRVFVAYAIGNFISNQYWRYSTDGMILNIDLEKQTAKQHLKISIIFLQQLFGNTMDLKQKMKLQ